MGSNKKIDVLNSLVQINNDRIEGYENASVSTEERELKDLFSTFIQTSKICLDELTREIEKFGGKPAESGKFFRTWMDVKSAIAGKKRRKILKSCKYGEENAIRVYNNVLNKKSEHLNLHQQEMIKSQLDLLKTDLSIVKSKQVALIDAPSS